jgi:hypothetical protein
MCCARPAALISTHGRAGLIGRITGPGAWYLDAVAQATHYQGAASTQFASLATTGFGFVSTGGWLSDPAAAVRTGLRAGTVGADTLATCVVRRRQ